jgi:type IV pilus assembly protein PilB
MAQRLTRRLCTNCKKEVPLDGKVKAIVDHTVSTIPHLEKYIEKIPNVVFEPQGCTSCNGTGFKGRVGIFEAILSTEEIEKAVELSPSERDIWRAAKSQNILNMKQDGILKILKGITSLHELERVIDVETDYF